MILASVLNCNGYVPFMELDKRGRSKVVIWILPHDEVDDFAEELIEEYAAGKCRVEPKKFAREQRAVRKAMYTFLGIGDRPQNTPVHNRSSV